MNILAIDLGTNCGWATWNGTRRDSGKELFDVKRGESPGMRYAKFNNWLTEKLNQMYLAGTQVDLVVYEATLPIHKSAMAAEIAHGLATRVQEACAKRGIEHTTVHGSTLKKWVTGSGRAKKSDMIAAVIARFTSASEPGEMDDDEADAIGILQWARKEFDENRGMKND